MGAAIFYRPVVVNSHRVPTVRPSSFIEEIEKVFGSFPALLNTADLRTLAAMQAVACNDGEEYAALIEGIEKFGSIEVFSGY